MARIEMKERRAPAGAAAILMGILLSLAVVKTDARAEPQDLVVKYDQSQIMLLPRPVGEIIIGNPMIAEIALRSSNTLVVTGKTFGVTNMIILDTDRNRMEERVITVVRDQTKIVSLSKAGKRESYNCSPQCNPALVIGDDPNYFDMVARLAEKKMKFSTEGPVSDNGSGQ
jgi:Flp pilus assembly secretin CpaC